MTTADPAELVEHCLAGDARALSQFVELFQQRVFGLCLRMLGHRQEAEDAAQESLVRAIRYLGNWDRSRPLEPWVLMIAANRCRTARANRLKRPRESETLAETPQRGPERDHDLAEELERALKELREDFRQCFVLFHQQELSIVEISQVLAVPEGTVKTWLHRARKELARLLTERGLSPMCPQEATTAE